jgi:hypothetical protein
MVIILTRRCIKPKMESEFLAEWRNTTPTHPGFISQTLTKLQASAGLPGPMQSLTFGCGNCLSYLNIARWESAADFQEHFKPADMHDPTYECSDRLRAVVEIVEVVGPAI